MGGIIQLFHDVYAGRRVLVTGHTGFKGSWLALWLKELGAEVAGYSAYLPSDPCNFQVLGLEKEIAHYTGDIRDLDTLCSALREFRPDTVFHLAAQAIVRRSYMEPKTTFDTNVGGTVNVLEAMRIVPGVRAAVMITSDKCYRNVEWEWGYRESDALGGEDPYSASKGCAELACRSYAMSFFKKTGPRLATSRAGNVIGGGDWAADRVVPDCVRAFAQGRAPVIRSPEATRPWQHVLEPLSGYLHLGADLIKSATQHGEAFNFGPNARVNQSVRELVEAFLEYWGPGSWEHVPATTAKKESTLLKLCCDRALQRLGWHATLDFNDTMRFTAEWYKAYYEGTADMRTFTASQIREYVDMAASQGLPWTGSDQA